jgi:hypothetical protein
MLRKRSSPEADPENEDEGMVELKKVAEELWGCMAIGSFTVMSISLFICGNRMTAM